MASEPLSAEYAKSGKAGCKGCGKSINKGELRVGFVGKANFGATAWYHYDCIWRDEENLKSIDAKKGAKLLVQNYDELKDDDKKRLDGDLPKYCKQAAEKASKAEPKPKSDMAAEYAPSAKSNCKGCSKAIEKGALRVGFPGKANFGATAWYHYECIWNETSYLAPINTSKSLEKIVDGFKNLKKEDQTKLQKDLKKQCETAVKKESEPKPPSLKMAAEYAKSDKSECKGCSSKISKNTLRVGFTGKANYGAVAWYHLNCLKKCQKEYLEGIKAGEPMKSIVEGFDKLNKDDQKNIESEVKALLPGAPKRKSEGGEKSVPAKKGKK
ncbi:uncharacterized protein LOC134279359 [Saccostrea cucullata]|uniref:uncharacterized protein LOC134279359 n=1 Tax=Saccostrea cuccullata TaxID=36930 RepID=UPI002ED27E85